MSNTPTTDVLRHRSIALRQRAAALLPAASDEGVQALVRRAVADIDDADRWVQEPGAERRPYLLKLVQVALDLADQRLIAVNDLLQTYGPEIQLLG